MVLVKSDALPLFDIPAAAAAATSGILAILTLLTPTDPIETLLIVDRFGSVNDALSFLGVDTRALCVRSGVGAIPCASAMSNVASAKNGKWFESSDKSSSSSYDWSSDSWDPGDELISDSFVLLVCWWSLLFIVVLVFLAGELLVLGVLVLVLLVAADAPDKPPSSVKALSMIL